MTERATPACAARIDVAPTTSPPAELLLLELVVIAGELDEVSEGDTVEEVLLTRTIVLEGLAEEDTLVVFVGTVVLVLTERYEGAGTAVDGSVSAPAPQGIASPLGWVGFAGGVVAPPGPAMAKRPVHERFWEVAEVN
jgi:hypothetical protein